MATVGICGFECDYNGSLNPTGAHHYNNNGTTAIDTTIFHGGGGGRSIKVTAAGAAAAHGVFLSVAASNVRVLSFWMYIASLPAANAEFFRAVKGTATRDACLGFEQSSSKLCVYGQTNFAGRTLGPVLKAATWTRIDLSISGTGQTIDWKVDLASQTQHAIGGTSGTFGTVMLFGHNASTEVAFSTYTGYFDDVALSTTAGDFPLQTDFVLGFVPFDDGTHSMGAGTNFTDSAGTIISGSNKAFQYLNELPPTTTNRVEQRLDTSGLLYVEVRFNSTTLDKTPLAADFTTCWRAATAASAAGQIKMRDNAGTTDDAIVNTTVAVTTDTYFTKHYATRPAALGAWTMAAAQDVRARFGFGTDVTPDIWFGGIVMEMAFAASSQPLVQQNPYIQVLPQ